MTEQYFDRLLAIEKELGRLETQFDTQPKPTPTAKVLARIERQIERLQKYVAGEATETDRHMSILDSMEARDERNQANLDRAAANLDHLERSLNDEAEPLVSTQERLATVEDRKATLNRLIQAANQIAKLAQEGLDNEADDEDEGSQAA